MVVDGPLRDVGLSVLSSLRALDRNHTRVPIPPFSLFFHGHFPGCLGGTEQDGGLPSHEHLPKTLLGANMYFVAVAETGNPEAGNLQGRGLLQQPGET